MRSVKQLAVEMHVFLEVAPLVVLADGKETKWFCEILPGYMRIQELVTRPRLPLQKKDIAINTWTGRHKHVLEDTKGIVPASSIHTLRATRLL